MRVSAVLAASENGVIGKNNQLPWHLPADLKFFKRLTTGHTIIMGRKTYESIGRPLPKRRNVIITRQEGYQAPSCEVVHSLEAALEMATTEDEVFVIGGAGIHTMALEKDLLDRIYLTLVRATVEGDTFIALPAPPAWKLVSQEDHPADDRNPYPFSFVTWDRI